MTTPPFSLRLDARTRARLEKAAKSQNRSAAFVVQRALNTYLDVQERFQKDMEDAIAEADKGVFVSQEAMHVWMASWDTDNELPPPEPDIIPPGHETGKRA